jgi:hypothetical protein
MLYYAFEIITDTAYDVHVNQTESAMNTALEVIRSHYGVDNIEAVAIGTVEADTAEDAIGKIRSGDWLYSQSG